MNWTLGQLKTFCAVAEYGTMTSAAKQLGYTVGAISQQMASLQSAVAAELFIRDGRALRLSEIGVALLVHARPLIEAERKAARAITGRLQSQEDVVKVGVMGSAGLFAVHPTIERLKITAPQVSFQAFETTIEDMPRAVLEGDVDIALSLNYPDAPYPPHRGLITTTVFTEKFQILLPPEAGPFALSPTKVIEFANRFSWILPPTDSFFGRAVLFACARAGISPEERHIVSGTALRIALVEAGLGLTLVTPLMMSLRPAKVYVSELPAPAFREVIVLARASSLQRESVREVQAALQHTFKSAWNRANPEVGILTPDLSSQAPIS